MKVIIPMAGMGKRMRPHTLTVPKPLIPVAGKPMVQRIVEDLSKLSPEKITEIGFIVGNFGKEAEEHLIKTAHELGAEGKIFYQEEARGIAHALLCAGEMLDGKIIVAFADTLFIPDTKNKIDLNKDGIIWVQRVEDPSQFGVVKVGEDGFITEFAEKPQTYVSDLAIIGIYYFRDGANLKKELQYLIDNDIKEKGEYQLTTALANMQKKGVKFSTSHVKEWLDCGNKNATIHTNKRILEVYGANGHSGVTVGENSNSIIIQPSTIGQGVTLINSKVGPYASIGDNTLIENSVIENCIIQTHSKVKNAKLSNSMLGNYVEFTGDSSNASIGDYSVIGY